MDGKEGVKDLLTGYLILMSTLLSYYQHSIINHILDEMGEYHC